MPMQYAECMKSELDLFSKPAIQSNITKSEEVAYRPINSIENASVIEFVSLGHGFTYRDLSSIYIKLKVKIKKSPTEEHIDATTGVVNNLLHSVFNTTSVYLNGRALSNYDNNYSYRAYLEAILNYGM